MWRINHIVWCCYILFSRVHAETVGVVDEYHCENCLHDNTSSSEETTETVVTNHGVDFIKSGEISGIQVYEDTGEAVDILLVQTSNGPVAGHIVNDIRNFYDIPYGRIEDIFQEALPPYSWTETHEAVEHTSKCPQLVEGEVTGDLSCLTLSVFAPLAATNAPVLLYIHEGYFRQGSGDPLKYIPYHLVGRGLILVLPNYRLGPLGFACLQNDDIPGNAGLKDITLALNWTATNIKAFGGDPDNIAISGDGSAGALVGYLTISPLSAKYIAKAITESGSLLADWAIDRNPRETALQLARAMLDNDTVNETDILTENYTALIENSQHILFKPCVESDSSGFLPKGPWTMLQSESNTICHLIGSSSHAGHQDAVYYNSSLDAESLIPSDLTFKDNETKRETFERVWLQYFESLETVGGNVTALSLLFTDSRYLGPSVRAARALVLGGSDVYFYEFSYQGVRNVESVELAEPAPGAVRGDLVGYLFPSTLAEEDTSDTTADTNMVNFLTDLWITFITNGVPSSNGLTWDKMDVTEESEENWLSIGEVVDQIAGIHPERLELWSRIYEDYYIDNNDANSIQPLAILILTAALHWG